MEKEQTVVFRHHKKMYFKDIEDSEAIKLFNEEAFKKGYVPMGSKVITEYLDGVIEPLRSVVGLCGFAGKNRARIIGPKEYPLVSSFINPPNPRT